MEKTARIEKLRQSALDKFTGIEEFLYYFYEKWDVKCPNIGSRRMRKRRNGSGSSEKTRPVK